MSSKNNGQFCRLSDCWRCFKHAFGWSVKRDISLLLTFLSVSFCVHGITCPSFSQSTFKLLVFQRYFQSEAYFSIHLRHGLWDKKPQIASLLSTVCPNGDWELRLEYNFSRPPFSVVLRLHDWLTCREWKNSSRGKMTHLLVVSRSGADY